MTFGNYNLTSQDNTKKRRHIMTFRLRKVKSTANYLVGRFNTKIETFRKITSNTNRCESPLSYEASLFEENGFRKNNKKFVEKDFPRRFFAEGNIYTFSTLNKWSESRTISGKNKQFIHNVYHPINDDDNNNNLSVKRRRQRQQQQRCDSLNLRELLNLKIEDENLEYKVLKDYFETNSYSDIVNDSDFKSYLNMKNYGDILDYLNTDISENDSDSVPTNYSNYSSIKRATVKSSRKLMAADSESVTVPCIPRVYKTWGHNYRESSKLINTKMKPKPRSNFCDSLKRLKKIFAADDDDEKKGIKKEVYKLHDKNCSYAKRYCELISYCETFLNQYLTVDKQLYKFRGSGVNYSESNYHKIIKRFVRLKGFNSEENYVKFTYCNLLDRILENQSNPHVENKMENCLNNSFEFREKLKRSSTEILQNFLFEDAFKNYDYVSHTLPNRKKTLSTDLMDVIKYNNVYFNRRYFDDISEHYYHNKCNISDDYISLNDDDDETNVSKNEQLIFNQRKLKVDSLYSSDDDNNCVCLSNNFIGGGLNIFFYSFLMLTFFFNFVSGIS